MLLPNETALHAFKTNRDIAIFTEKRLIVSDAQGITGKKKEMYSLPDSSILMYATENARVVDANAEVTLWTEFALIKINLKKGINIREFDMILSSAILK